jgi:hypothetical protein
VLATVIAVLLTAWYWLLIALAYGFWARLLTGPKLKYTSAKYCYGGFKGVIGSGT